MHKQQEELGWLRRPARRQVDESTIKREEHRDSGSHNVWSGRSLDRTGGPDRTSGRPAKERSKYRCRPELDVGRTRGSDAKQMQFCLYFAKGCCSQGSACVYLHRLPTEEDEEYHKRDIAADIFGREKRAEHEGYRKGAGTFERDNRTVYCNYEGAGSYDLPKVRQLIEDNFNMWGPVKRIYIVHNKTLAFVEYEWRSTAEFAKEAMHKQGLTGSSQREVLTLRWANEDPNPTTIVAVKRSHMNAFERAAMSSWEALPEEQKQARIHQLQMAQALHKGRVIADYPTTDGQYACADGQYPSTDDQYPSTDGQYPSTDGQYPSTDGQYPSTDDQYPDTDAQYGGPGLQSGGGAQHASSSGQGATAAGADADSQFYGGMTAEQYADYCEQYYAQHAHEQQYVHDEGGNVAAGARTGQPAAQQEEHHGGSEENALVLLAGYGSSSEEEEQPEGQQLQQQQQQQQQQRSGGEQAEQQQQQQQSGGEQAEQQQQQQGGGEQAQQQQQQQQGGGEQAEQQQQQQQGGGEQAEQQQQQQGGGEQAEQQRHDSQGHLTGHSEQPWQGQGGAGQ